MKVCTFRRAKTKAGELFPTAAHEVNDFQLVAVLECCGFPVGARDDVAIEFDGDAIAFHLQFGNELGDVGGGDLALFAVNSELHDSKLSLPAENLPVG